MFKDKATRNFQKGHSRKITCFSRVCYSSVICCNELYLKMYLNSMKIQIKIACNVHTWDDHFSTKFQAMETSTTMSTIFRIFLFFLITRALCGAVMNHRIIWPFLWGNCSIGLKKGNKTPYKDSTAISLKSGKLSLYFTYHLGRGRFMKWDLKCKTDQLTHMLVRHRAK